MSAPVGPGEYRIERIEERGLAVLRVPGPRLEITGREEFTAACARLLAEPAKKVVVDISAVEGIFSLFIGTLVDVHVRAERAGKRLSVMVSDPVRESLERMGLEGTLDLILSGTPPE